MSLCAQRLAASGCDALVARAAGGGARVPALGTRAPAGRHRHRLHLRAADAGRADGAQEPLHVLRAAAEPGAQRPPQRPAARRTARPLAAPRAQTRTRDCNMACCELSITQCDISTGEPSVLHADARHRILWRTARGSLDDLPAGADAGGGRVLPARLYARAHDPAGDRQLLPARSDEQRDGVGGRHVREHPPPLGALLRVRVLGPHGHSHRVRRRLGALREAARAAARGPHALHGHRVLHLVRPAPLHSGHRARADDRRARHRVAHGARLHLPACRPARAHGALSHPEDRALHRALHRRRRPETETTAAGSTSLSRLLNLTGAKDTIPRPTTPTSAHDFLVRLALSSAPGLRAQLDMLCIRTMPPQVDQCNVLSSCPLRLTIPLLVLPALIFIHSFI